MGYQKGILSAVFYIAADFFPYMNRRKYGRKKSYKDLGKAVIAAFAAH